MRVRRRRRIALGSALAGIAAMAACTLNPQPLPPVEDTSRGDAAAFGGSADGGLGQATTTAPVAADASAGVEGDASPPKTPTPDLDDAGDAGDGGAGDGGAGDGDAGDHDQ